MLQLPKTGHNLSPWSFLVALLRVTLTRDEGAVPDSTCRAEARAVVVLFASA